MLAMPDGMLRALILVALHFCPVKLCFNVNLCSNDFRNVWPEIAIPGVRVPCSTVLARRVTYSLHIPDGIQCASIFQMVCSCLRFRIVLYSDLFFEGIAQLGSLDDDL